MCCTNIRSAFLPFSGSQTVEAAGKFDFFLDVVLAEGRIGEHPVVAAQFVVVVLVLRLLMVSSCRMSAWAMPCSSMFILQIDQVVPIFSWPKSDMIARVAAALAQVVARLDQHAAGADRRVVDAHVRLRIDDLDAARTTSAGV